MTLSVPRAPGAIVPSRGDYEGQRSRSARRRDARAIVGHENREPDATARSIIPPAIGPRRRIRSETRLEMLDEEARQRGSL